MVGKGVGLSPFGGSELLNSLTGHNGLKIASNGLVRGLLCISTEIAKADPGTSVGIPVLGDCFIYSATHHFLPLPLPQFPRVHFCLPPTV